MNLSSQDMICIMLLYIAIILAAIFFLLYTSYPLTLAIFPFTLLLVIYNQNPNMMRAALIRRSGILKGIVGSGTAASLRGGNEAMKHFCISWNHLKIFECLAHSYCSSYSKTLMSIST